MTSKPMVSVLCATHNRAPFIPWLEWNWHRQDYPSCELILVDSSDDLVAVREAKRLASCPDVLYARASENSIGKKLQLAMELASGQYVMIWCDDDWQHPLRIQHSVDAALTYDADVIGWETGHFLNLETRQVAQYHASGIITSAVAALVKTNVGRLVPFEDRVAEDTAWIEKVLKRAQRPLALPAFSFIHSLWLVHDRNTMQRRTYRWRLPLEETLNLGHHLGDTVAQLDALQARLKKDPRAAVGG